MHKKFVLISICLFVSLITILFVVSSQKSYAVPAYPGLFELKQPSGYAFEARKRGDEWYNWVETKDGYGIYKNTVTGNWEYYVPFADSKITGLLGRIQDSSVKAIVGETDPASLGVPNGLHPPMPLKFSPHNCVRKELKREVRDTAVKGAMNLLVIGVDFADCPASYKAEDVQAMAFGSSNSIADYFNKVSYSAVTITPAKETHGTANDGFIGWLRVSGNHPNTGSNHDFASLTKIDQSVKSAITASDSYIDYASYDTNKNSIIESTELSIMIIFAGYIADINSPPSPTMGQGASTAISVISVDGKVIPEYAYCSEKIYNGNGEHYLMTLGIPSHELGHLMFSLPDLYDTDSSNGYSFGVGDFDLMGNGAGASAYGGLFGSSPTLLSAWCREFLGWGSVTIVSSSQTISPPKADSNSGSIFRINTSNSNQYFLIENRQFAGYDRGFESSAGASGHGGLAIYHIDKSKTEGNAYKYNIVNADVNNKGVDVEEANEGSLGYSMLDTVVRASDTNMFFFSGNNTSFTDTTKPDARLKDGSYTNISIANISTYGDVMTASITVPYTTPTPTPTPTATPTPTEECEDAENISASPSELKLNTKGSDKVTVAVTGKNGCHVEGDSIKASVSNSSLVTVSPRSRTTDENGQAVFTIKAKNKTGNAVVTFRDGSLNTQVSVTVKK